MALPQQSRSGLQARHTCHCGKSFARKEHLTRHQATHNQPTHICDICQRRFTRRELLRRHLALHDPNRTRVVVSCDACRANKTKCSGSLPCSLCARRGINCTFGGTHHRSSDEPTSHRITASDVSIGEHVEGGDVDDEIEGNDSESIQPRNTTSETILDDKPPRSEQALLSPGWLQDLLIVPSKPVKSSDSQPMKPGMKTMYEILQTEKSALEVAGEVSDEMQAWLSKCLAIYFKHFHLRWPILNAPSFDATTASLPLAASVCMIGTWLNHNATQDETLGAMRVHEALLHRLFHKLIDPKTMPEGQAWPIELLQATLLSLIFSLYRPETTPLNESTLLRNLFVTILREKGMFKTETLIGHLRTHFTGTYAPYTISMRERFKRLLASTFQYDVYFALAYEKPPTLYRHEIGSDLTITFALWNAYGLDIFASRLPEEPMERAGFRISAMTAHPGSFTASQLLIEDVTLGLCGVLQTMWVFMQSSPSTTNEDHGKTIQRALIIETLDGWKHELDKIKRLADSRELIANTGKYLLMAYRGEDSSVTTILERINTLVQDGIVLYYHLKMYYHADLCPSDFSQALKQTKEPYPKVWPRIKDGENVLICALRILQMTHSQGALGESTNPLRKHALTTGAILARKLLETCDICECLAAGAQYASEADLPRLTRIDGLLCIDNTRLCVQKLKFWSERLDKAIEDQRNTVVSTISTVAS